MLVLEQEEYKREEECIFPEAITVLVEIDKTVIQRATADGKLPNHFQRSESFNPPL